MFTCAKRPIENDNHWGKKGAVSNVVEYSFKLLKMCYR